MKCQGKSNNCFFLSLSHKKLRFSLSSTLDVLFAAPKQYPWGFYLREWFHFCGKHVAITENNPIFKDRVWLRGPHSLCSLSLVLAVVPCSGTPSFPHFAPWGHVASLSVVREDRSGWEPWLGEAPRTRLVWVDIHLMPSCWPAIWDLCLVCLQLTCPPPPYSGNDQDVWIKMEASFTALTGVRGSFPKFLVLLEGFASTKWWL